MNTTANQQKRSLNKKPSKLLKLTKETSKLVKRTALDAILLKMRQTKNNNEGRLPKGFMTDIVREMNGEFPWLNRDKINYHYQTWTKQKLYQRMRMILILEPLTKTLLPIPS